MGVGLGVSKGDGMGLGERAIRFHLNSVQFPSKLRHQKY
jgi:hypothetical protein